MSWPPGPAICIWIVFVLSDCEITCDALHLIRFCTLHVLDRVEDLLLRRPDARGEIGGPRLAVMHDVLRQHPRLARPMLLVEVVSDRWR